MAIGPALASTGIGSGLDVNSILNKLMSIEQQPYNRATAQIKSYNTELSSVGQMQSLVGTMRDKAQALTGASLWGTKAVASGDAAVLTGSATSDAAAGTYAVSVSQLASRQTALTGAFTDSAAVLGEGKLRIELGSWDGPPATAFTGRAGASAIEIDVSGDTSLAAVRDKINAAKSGVTASIVNDANGARLSLSATDSGAANGFRITATEASDDGNAATGLSALAVDPTQSGAAALTQWAANARATINGIAVESASNTFNGVSDGLSITVGKVSTAPVNLTVTPDNAAVKTAINEFVNAYNAMNSYVRTQTKYDEATKTGGIFQGDATINSVMAQMRGVVNQSVSMAGSPWSSLSQVGISMQGDGALKVDDTKLTEALKNSTELRNVLTADGATSATTGFMRRFANLGNQVLASDGSLEVKEQSIQARIKNATNLQASLQTRMDQTEARLRAQYQALDKSMASLNSLSSYVVQQMAMLNSGR